MLGGSVKYSAMETRIRGNAVRDGNWKPWDQQSHRNHESANRECRKQMHTGQENNTHTQIEKRRDKWTDGEIHHEVKERFPDDHGLVCPVMCETWKRSTVRNDVDISVEKEKKRRIRIYTEADVQIDRTDKPTDGQTEERQTDRQRWQCSGNEQVEGGADRGGARRGGPRVRGKEVGGRTEKGA